VRLQVQFALKTLRGVRQRGEQLEPLREVRNGFGMRRALDRPLARSLPVGKGLLDESPLRVVVRQQLGLGLSRLRKLGFQDLGNALMVLLSRTF
jgi:hypothetical protein